MLPSLAAVTSLPALLGRNAEWIGQQVALHSAGDPSCTHRQLAMQMEYVVPRLRALGIGPDARVALVLPQGPEAATVFLTVACAAIAAPLNPQYKQAEFAFYLEDLGARALIVMQGMDSPSRAAAAALNISILELVPDRAAAGLFTLHGSAAGPRCDGGPAGPEAVALVLHTSGTTARPKQVPLSHANLCASAGHIGAVLALTPADRCLNVMPLFHIHGLVACVLAPLAAGGSTVCGRTSGAGGFFADLEAWRPSWYSAVPTMHQSIMVEAEHRPVPIASSLRLIRSSSAALPPSVMAGLERAFAVPVLESYGMTEAAHQMASNPLPPAVRKPGSVGRPAGPRMTILDTSGAEVAQGVTGEIAIQGPNVTAGYFGDPEANASAFVKGWFRTGDQGYFDADGYLHITGRLKEIINRGGEKIAPREVDEVLLAHPTVAQAVAFAVPHPTLGEDLAAAVVLKAGANTREVDLRSFAMECLPHFKIPSRILLLTEIPKGATGKIQRVGLAAKLADAMAIPYAAPQTDMERRVASLMEEMLGRRGLGRDDNFFMAGGDSLPATRILARLRQELNLELSATLVLRFPSPRLLAADLDTRLAEREVAALAAELAGLSEEARARLLGEL